MGNKQESNARTLEVLGRFNPQYPMLKRKSLVYAGMLESNILCNE